MRSLAASLEALPAKTALLDGEVIVLDERGISSFAALQAAFQEGAAHALHYYVFDLLHLDGHSLRTLPLTERKTLLADLVTGLDDDAVRLSEHVRDEKAAIFDEICRHGAEGIVSKRADSLYVSGRSASWVKVKCGLRQEFVIGGFTLPSKGGDGIGALLLGYYQDGKLIYAGRTGTGFTQKTQAQLRKRLEAISSDTNPFVAIGTAERRGALWVKPQLVAEVAFSTWTADNLVRQASFKGLREDKPAKEVVRETALHGIPNARAASVGRNNKRAAPQLPPKPPTLERCLASRILTRLSIAKAGSPRNSSSRTTPRLPITYCRTSRPPPQHRSLPFRHSCEVLLPETREARLTQGNRFSRNRRSQERQA